jgi:rubredoxin/uncharacterized membrane protein
MKEWKCTVCGYVHKGVEPPEKCPVCGADKSKFIEMPQNTTAATPPQEVHRSQNHTDDTLQSENTARWRCTVCGYVHEGAEPPEKCPVCGADKSKFVAVTDTPQPIAASAGRVEDSRPRSKKAPARPAYAWFRYPQVLTRLHGHPMTVHIPNGVLPVSVLFMLLSVWFESVSLAAAAKYNLFFVTLAMPAVIVSGLGDWINRYGGRMTKVFSTKMICAGIVTVMSLTLSLWWLIQPEVYLGNAARIGTFIIFHLIALAAAIVAGWYGGKLVFPKK